MKEAGRIMMRLRFRRDVEGQASVIGTIMAIMILLAFLSLVTTQYVPLTMTDYEAQHMNTVVSEFATLRQNIDSLIINRQTSMGMFSTMTLGTSSVPVFSAPTASRLSFTPPNATFGNCDIAFDTEDYGLITETSGGSVDLYAGNRYFIPQTVFYENSAVIISQDSGQSVRARPHFDAEMIGSSIMLSVTMVDLLGMPNSITGTSTVGIQTYLQVATTWQYFNVTSNITYSVSTRNTQAWESIFNTSLQGIGAENYQINVTEPVDRYSTGANGYGVVVVEISNVDTIVLTTASLTISLGAS